MDHWPVTLDTMYGGPGDDSLRPWSGDGLAYGGDGNDTLTAAAYYSYNDYDPLTPDYLNCGPGTADEVTYDKGIDRVRKSCEIRYPRVGRL